MSWQATDDLESSQVFFDYSAFIARFKIVRWLNTAPSEKECKFVSRPLDSIEYFINALGIILLEYLNDF